MRQIISKFTKTILLLFISFSLFAQGKLLLVGGGGEKSGGWSDAPYTAAVNAAANKKVAIISVNDETNVLPNYFLSLGAIEAINVKIDSYTEANKQSTYDLLMGYDLIFIKGGNQANYYDYYKNSKTQEALRDKFLAGGVLAGTSAGAMILSGVISLETVYPNETLENIHNPYVDLVDDFLDVMDGFLVDTHFIERGRFARLLPFMAKWKQDTGESVTGLGIDDQTAIFIDHNKIGTVYGTASVAVYPASETSKFDVQNNRLYTSSPVRHIALTDGDIINLNTLAITYSYSSTIIPTFVSETRTQILYLGGGVTLNDNQPLLKEFAQENNLTDEILIVTESSVTRANQFKTALHGEGVPTVNIKQQDGALLALDPDWEAKVASAQKIIIMEVTYNKFMAFLGSVGGASLNAKIQNQAIPVALIGENANLAGRRVATRVKDDVYAAYDGLLGFDDGLSLLHSVIVVSNTFFSGTSYRNYYENKSCAVPYGMLIEDAKYGLWLSPTNWAKITSNGTRRDIVVRGTNTGTTPGLLFANSNAGTIGRATPFQYFNNTLNIMTSRSVVGYNDLRITYMYSTHKYDLNGGAPEEIQYFPPATTEIYWIDSDDKRIYKSVNGGTPQIIAASGVAGTGIAYNPFDGKIYATNATGNASRSIVRMDLDGSNFETFLNSTELNNQDPNMIAIDPDNGDIYYSVRASSPRRIAKVSMDKTTHVTSWLTGLANPESMAIFRGKMYVMDAGVGSQEGLHVIDLANPVLNRKSTKWGYGVAVDTLNELVYFFSGAAGDRRIYRTDLDGNNLSLFPTSINPVGARAAIEVDPYNKKVYWSASASGDIFSADFDGSNQQTIINSSYARQLFVRVTPPIILTITAITGTSVSLSWNDVTNESGYEIHRSTNKLFSTFTTFTVGADVTTFTDTTVQPFTTYYYRVRAMKQ